MLEPLKNRYLTLGLTTLLVACGSSTPPAGEAPETPAGPQLSAAADLASTTVDTPVTIDVLQNDSADSGPLLLDSFDAASAEGGSVVRDDQGTPETNDDQLTYTPPAGFSGSDSFSYSISDAEGQTDSATVTVQIVPPPPEIAGDCAITGADRTALTDAARTNPELFDEQDDPPDGYCYETTFDSHDGTSIAIQVFVPHPDKLRAIADQRLAALGQPPLAPGEPGFAPLVIHSHGFGGNKAEDFHPVLTAIDTQVALDAWKAGYWVISYTQRGFGPKSGDPQANETASGGQIGVMSPALEGFDFVRLVDWAISHLRENFDDEAATPAELNDPEAGNQGNDFGASLLMTDAGARLTSFNDDVAIGAIGYSYGGGFQFNAQSVDPRLDALVPLGTWHDLRYSLSPNDTPKTAWITLLATFAAQGGNDEQLPDVIPNAGAEAFGANTQPDDQPHNKQRQVAVRNYNILGPNGPVAYCDGNAAAYGAKTADGDNEPVDFPIAIPENAVISRVPRADLLMIQGYGDTLFNFNEGYDNARCFEEVGGLDVRFIAETSGHPLPGVGPVHYAGVDTSMYLDEIIHCGTDGNGDPVRYNTREMAMNWYDDKLRGVGDFNAYFPHAACITQENTDPNLVLDITDEFFNHGTTNTAARAHRFSREGAVFATIADVPVGGGQFDLDETTVTTGPSPQGAGPQPVFTPVYTVPDGISQVMAGIPTANLTVARQNTSADEIVFVGVSVRRCHDDPNTVGACTYATTDNLHFQVAALRLFPSPAAAAASLSPPPGSADFPQDDPKNFDGESKGNFYSIRWGGNPGAGNDAAEGRLPGVTARLHPGDQVGLQFFAEHPVYTSINSGTVGQVTVTGTVQLPLQFPTTAPANQPAYVIAAP